MPKLTISEAGRGLIALHRYPESEYDNIDYWRFICEDEYTITLRWVPTGSVYIANKEDRTIGGYFYDVRKIPT